MKARSHYYQAAIQVDDRAKVDVQRLKKDGPSGTTLSSVLFEPITKQGYRCDLWLFSVEVDSFTAFARKHQ